MALVEVTEWMNINVRDYFKTNVLEVISSALKLVEYQLRLTKAYNDSKQFYISQGWTIKDDFPDEFKFTAERKYFKDDN